MFLISKVSSEFSPRKFANFPTIATPKFSSFFSKWFSETSATTHKIFFLPYGISTNCPGKISERKESPTKYVRGSVEKDVPCGIIFASILESKSFFDFVGFLFIKSRLFGSARFFCINVFELFPFVLCLHNQSFNDFAFRCH